MSNTLFYSAKNLLKGEKSKKIEKDDISSSYENVEEFSRDDRKANKNYLFLIYSLLHLNGATNFEGHAIKNAEKIDVHHIFPKTIVNEDIDDDLINDFSNITFISEKVNKGLSDKLPEEYLLKYKEKDLEKHFIPTRKELYRKENCKDFLDERAVLIWKGVQKYINNKLKE